MPYIRGRYSWLMRPLLFVTDALVINILVFYFFNLNNEPLYFFKNHLLNNKHILYVLFSVVFWWYSTLLTGFYRVYRYTSILTVIWLIIKQFVSYSLLFYAFLGFFRSLDIQIFEAFNYLLSVFGFISFFKIFSFYALRVFRKWYKGNLRQVVVIGGSEKTKDLVSIFNSKENLGYKVLALFEASDLEDNSGNITDAFNYIQNHKEIDELYCEIDYLSEHEVNQLVKYAELNHINIKFIQDSGKRINKHLKADYYDYLPVLSIQEVALNNDFNKAIKRVFDIVFSMLVMIFVLSWLCPLLFVLIKLESKGPLFYKHQRNGINYKEFNCFKFRSLRINGEVKGTYVTKQDDRLTNIGAFLRRTSIDEIPQFINVFLGDMSVVGPRPHMLSYTDDYSTKIDKVNFIFRHNVKPGITGLAQVKGYRGEVKKDADIINRFNYDNFYIENWTLLLDLKIIIQTIGHFFTGQKEAY